MIEIKHLNKSFGEVHAVNDLSLVVKEGINGLVGENGAGKSTLLRLISDVYQKDDGDILIDGMEHNTIENKNNVFFLSDSPYFPNNATIQQTFAFYQTLFSLDEERFNTIMDSLSLPKERKVSTYSKGMRRQFFLAIALSSHAKYILLDEAFDGLDPLVLDVMKQEIIKDANNKTFIVSSHNISSLERLCNNFILLSEGRCKMNGNVEQLGENFTKYQIYAKETISQKDLENKGYKILSYKQVGSILHVVFYDEVGLEDFEKNFDVVLFEKISIDPDELITLQMLSARKENER